MDCMIGVVTLAEFQGRGWIRCVFRKETMRSECVVRIAWVRYNLLFL